MTPPTVSGPQGNPFDAEASIPEDTGVEGSTPAGNAPNDDESAQQGEIPDVTGPQSDGGEGVAPAEYVATDGDVQGDGRSTQDLKDRRVVDPDAPMDYNTLPDGSDVQGNHYPPGPDFYKAELARAEQAKLDAEQAVEDAQAALDAAADAHDENVGANAKTIQAVNENVNEDV